ncbi:MAG: hypothetical protein H6937_06980 [Burkholderiales bacterium]|nr:hypothetical protein [Burkholderiales bacterium]
MKVKIQSTFIGYNGGACTVYSILYTEKSVLAVGVQGKYQTNRRDEQHIVITNDPDIDRDKLFTDDNIKDAISAFYALENGVSHDGKSSRLVFSDRAARANPKSAIEKDGIDTSGPRYRISESVTCGQMAVLATCLHALKAGKVEQALDMADELTILISGDSKTQELADELERLRNGEVISI